VITRDDEDASQRCRKICAESRVKKPIYKLIVCLVFFRLQVQIFINMSFFVSGRNSNENIGSPKQIMNIENFHERSQMQREQHAGVSFKDIYFYLRLVVTQAYCIFLYV